MIFNPTDPLYSADIRQFQGCPTLAVTPKGRIFQGWYSGGNAEPRIENYDILVYSDDGGKTWSKTLLVILSSRQTLIHSIDIQLFIDPDGKLHVVWVQNDVKEAKETDVDNFTPANPVCVREGYVFDDFTHASWEMVCDDPDADELKFSEPRYIFDGFMRCKPLFLSSGEWIAFAYDQLSDRHAYNISTDKGKTWTRMHGGKKLLTPFDEGMAYEMLDGTLRLLVRNELGEIGEAYSFDKGKTWTDTKLSGIISPSTRHYIARTPSGRIILVHNEHNKKRTNMTIKLSEDDGKTWKYSLLLDDRNDLSYPDLDFYDGKIFMTYDRERGGAKEIFFLSFTEDDIINGVKPEVTIVSKPGLTEI